MYKVFGLLWILLHGSMSFSNAQGIVRPVQYNDSLQFSGNKAVLYEFTASWCVPCKQMEATTLKDPSVLNYIDSNYIWVVVDIDKPEGKKLGIRFSVNQYPTFIAADPINDEVFLRIIGFKPAVIFLNDLKFAIRDTRFD